MGQNCEEHAHVLEENLLKATSSKNGSGTGSRITFAARASMPRSQITVNRVYETAHQVCAAYMTEGDTHNWIVAVDSHTFAECRTKWRCPNGSNFVRHGRRSKRMWKCSSKTTDTPEPTHTQEACLLLFRIFIFLSTWPPRKGTSI